MNNETKGVTLPYLLLWPGILVHFDPVYILRSHYTFFHKLWGQTFIQLLLLLVDFHNTTYNSLTADRW